MVRNCPKRAEIPGDGMDDEAISLVMVSGRPRYQGGEISDRGAFRLAEPEMGDEEYVAYRAA
jgi:hypothetical protein